MDKNIENQKKYLFSHLIHWQNPVKRANGREETSTHGNSLLGLKGRDEETVLKSEIRFLHRYCAVQHAENFKSVDIWYNLHWRFDEINQKYVPDREKNPKILSFNAPWEYFIFPETHDLGFSWLEAYFNPQFDLKQAFQFILPHLEQVYGASNAPESKKMMWASAYELATFKPVAGLSPEDCRTLYYWLANFENLIQNQGCKVLNLMEKEAQDA